MNYHDHHEMIVIRTSLNITHIKLTSILRILRFVSLAKRMGIDVLVPIQMHCFAYRCTRFCFPQQKVLGKVMTIKSISVMMVTKREWWVTCVRLSLFSDVSACRESDGKDFKIIYRNESEFQHYVALVSMQVFEPIYILGEPMH